MIFLTTLVMACGFIPMTMFGVALGGIAKTFGVSLTKMSLYTGDAFATGIFAAFIPGHSGWFDKRPKVGVTISMLLAIVPQLLFPVTSSLWLVTILRFCQGFVIMQLAVFTFQLSGWFRPAERGISLGFTVGAIAFGGFLGGMLTNALAPYGWKATMYASGLLMIAGLVIYLIFAKDAPSFMKQVMEAKAKPAAHVSIWRQPMSWIMGLVQVPMVWVLFTGGFVSLYALKVGHFSSHQVGTLNIVMGFSGLILSVVGAWLGDLACKGQTTNRGVVNARLKMIIIGNILMALAAILLITVGRSSFDALILVGILFEFMWFVSPNYWATPGVVYPTALMGAGAFAMGLISNAASPVGSFASTAILSMGWNGVFVLMAIICIIGIPICIWAMKYPLPSEDPRYTQAS